MRPKDCSLCAKIKESHEEHYCMEPETRSAGYGAWDKDHGAKES